MAFVSVREQLMVRHLHVDDGVAIPVLSDASVHARGLLHRRAALCYRSFMLWGRSLHVW